MGFLVPASSAARPQAISTHARWKHYEAAQGFNRGAKHFGGPTALCLGFRAAPKQPTEKVVAVASSSALSMGVIPVVSLILIASFASFLWGRRSARIGGINRLSNTDASDGDTALEWMESSSFEKEEGATPAWLNYAFARMWKLFQKNTKRLVKEVIQPVFDESEKPDFVTDIRVSSFKPGSQAPYLRSLKRLPSRALSEIQYKVQALFSSTSTLEFDVDLEFKGFKATVPVTMENLDVDAICWSSFSLVPFDPFCSSAKCSLLETPKISFDMTIASLVPITATPVLRSFFLKIITEEVPKQFIFPNVVDLDFTPEAMKDAAVEMSSAGEDIKNLSPKELETRFPEQWALFDALDLDNSGSLSPVELFAGLKDWGYTAQDAADSFESLDVNNDNSVSFDEFCRMWPALSASFVPDRYQGVLSIFVRDGEDIQQPKFGKADPLVMLELNDQTLRGKRDSQTSGDGAPGTPVWNEAFEMNCLDPEAEELKVTVLEGSKWNFRTGGPIGTASVPLKSFKERASQQLEIALEPEGILHVDLSYADFVDQVPRIVVP